MSHGTPIEISDEEMLKRQGEELKRLNGVIDSLRGRVQDLEVLRNRAEQVISLIRWSTTGDYEWCKRACVDYFTR